MNKITFPLKLQMKNLEVAHLHEALAFLGVTIIDAEKTNQRYGASTRAAVVKFQIAHNLPAMGAVDEATASAINKELLDKGALEAPPGGIDPTIPPPPSPENLSFSVQGEVVKPDGTALPNLVIRAYDRALCEWRLLNVPDTIVRTNDLGRYTLNYDPAQLKLWGKTRADLKIEVRDGAGADTILAESPLILQALPHETVNFSIGQDHYRGPDEFSRVETALKPLLGSHDDDLSCLTTADVLILAREAKRSASKVAYYVKARRWSATYSAPAALFYGLMRRGEPTRIDALWARPLARLWARLEEARSRNLISLPLNAALRTQLSQLQQSYLAKSDHPYARLLGTTSLTGEQTPVFTRRLTSGQDTSDAFWQALLSEEGFSAELIADLRATFDLQHFVGDNTSLSLRLRGELGVREPREVAVFSMAHWRDTVLADTAVEIPDTVRPRDPPKERRAAYAQLLFRSAEARWATASLRGQLARSPTSAQDPVLKPVLDFLLRNPDFEFNDTRVVGFLRENPQALGSGQDETRNALLRVEQLFHLTAVEDKLATIQPMLSAGLRTASQVAALGRNQLARRLGSAVDMRSVQRIYRKAVHVTSLALSLYLRFNPRLNRLSTTALSLPQAPAEVSPQAALARSAITLPEWEELFGSADACDCPHDQSALSPAAYLVDQLAFLEKAVDSAGNNALDELLARRPDLGNLRLTPENTETLLPHIDAVNEVLEAIVASADGQTLPATAIGETTWDSELLAAQPQYLNPVAYDVLRESRYPIQHLPFDLWAEEGRRYLHQLGIARHELMQALPAKPGVGRREIAAEALAMSRAERDLIGRPEIRPEDLARSWGIDLSLGTLSAQLRKVEALLQQAQIDYETLLRLLNTRYINPGRAIAVDFGDTPCALENAVLVDAAGTTLSDKPFREFLDRLHRFLRLHHRLGYTEYEIDTLLAALGVTDFNATGFFPDAADVTALRQALNLPLLELSTWWSVLDTYAFEDGLPSQYEAVFVSDALFPDIQVSTGLDLRNDVFALKADRTDLAITSSTDISLSKWLAQSDGATTPLYTLQPEYAAHIQSATRLTADDLLLLAQSWLPKDGVTGHVALNLANLSMLYRMASLTRALEVSVVDALRLFTIVGVVPLQTPAVPAGPSETREFRDIFIELDDGAYSIEALAYLLLHEADAVFALAPTSADIDAWLASVSPNFVGVLTTSEDEVLDELKASLTQSLGSALAVDTTVIDALLFTHRPALGLEMLAHMIVTANPDASDLPALHTDFGTLYGQLHKFGLAWNGLALDASFLAFVLDQGPALGWTDIAALPTTLQATGRYEPWRRLVTAAALQASSFTFDQPLFSLLQDAAAATAAQALDPASFVLADQLAQISNSTGWPLADITYLTGINGFNLDLPAAMQDERALGDLKRVFDLIRTKGVSAEQAHAWTIAELSFAEAQTIKQTLSLAFAPEHWLNVLGTIQDELRTLKRDALLGHALTNLGMKDSETFYRQYLLDPDVSPMERTSRIVLAHSAVQLFAQRILLNLEAFKFERLDAEAWQWRSRYRVWEAARKVFLWPENWLEPEWRDNKSAFFKELEDGLLQDEVTHENAERLYTDYLHKLNDVSRLEIAGLYSEEAGDEQAAVLHVFGRSVDVPRRYYYRRWEGQAIWTPWEPVGLDINADHLIPAVIGGRLYLIWPEFMQSDNPSATTTTTVAVELDPQRADEIRAEINSHQLRIDEIDELLSSPIVDSPNYKGDVDAFEAERDTHEAAIDDLEDELETLTGERTEVVLGDKYQMTIGMKWSEYRDGRWTGTQVSRDKLTYTTSNKLSRHYFTGWVGEDQVFRVSARINLLATGEGVLTARSIEGYIGYFYFNECGADLVASSAEVSDPEGDLLVSGSLPEFHAAAWYNTWWSSSSLELELRTTGEKRLLVEAAPGTLAYAHQDGQYGKESSPFFFSDGTRTYMVRLVSDIALAGSVGGDLVVNSALRRKAPRGSINGRLSRSIGSATSTTANAISAQHFESSDTGMVMSHSAFGLGTSSLQGEIGTLIASDPAPYVITGTATIGSTSSYVFTRFYHPYTCMFLQQQYRYGVDGVLNPDPAWGADSAELRRQLMPTTTFDFEATYNPNLDWVTDNFSSEQMSEQIDFDHASPFGSYHWELFFHIPLLVATRLMQAQRYADARRWFHYIFDPTSTDGVGSERYWKIKPFYLEQLNGPLASLNSLLNEANLDYEKQLEAWESDPFNVHAIARLRISAYMQSVVVRYIQCLLEEADMLFRRDTREDINAARQLYLLAAEILGERPMLLPEQDDASLTPNLLLHRFHFDWNGLLGGNPLDNLISNLPSSLPGAFAGPPAGARAVGTFSVNTSISTTGSVLPAVLAQGGTSSVDTLLLFCLPHNEMLYELWDTVADRLFKIRHSMNFSGVVRQLALFSPPIDPALLIRASAAGISIEDILSGLFTPRPCYRFVYLLQKALELCNDARSLGAAMLAALEKKDGEQLALLRSTHEVALLESISAIKKKNVDEAKASLASLVKSRESAEFRSAYYAGLERISVGEQSSLEKLEDSRHRQRDAEIAEITASILHAVPSVSISGQILLAVPGPPSGWSASSPDFGSAMQGVAAYFRARSAVHAYEANKTGTIAGYDRRKTDWNFQSDLARKEMAQLDQQIIAAEIRLQVAESDLANHQLQIEQAQAVGEFLELKFTNQQLYSWMVSKLASVHFQGYQMAYQIALQAQSAYVQELGPDEATANFIQPDNWDSLKKGLLAGELLQLQLRQMETAHLAANKRELEITKQVSLFQLDAAALLDLRATGACEFLLPDVWFALDFPGHYFRRIKSVSLTIPCVIGPYASVSATLKLVDSWTRRNANFDDPLQPENDLHDAPQTAIATSTAMRDAGMFELNFNDARYLPFEGAGAISRWRLELPSTLRPFDYATITDVVMQLSYTARDGGTEFKAAVEGDLVSALNKLTAPAGSGAMSRLMSLRHDFPDAWNQLMSVSGDDPRTCKFQLSKQLLPSYLDYVWSVAADESVGVTPLALNIDGLTAYLGPKGELPTTASDIVMNGQPQSPMYGNPSFDLTLAAGVLSGRTLVNANVIDCTLSVASPTFKPDEWRDLYLLMNYKIVT